MNLKHPLVYPALVILLASQVGCAMSRAGQLPEIASWPPSGPGDARSVSLMLSGESTVNDKEHEVSAQFLKTWKESTTKAYEDSQLFASVIPEAAATDRRVEIKVMDRGTYSAGLSVLTGFTLFLIPSKSTDEVTVSTTVKDRDGAVLGTYSKTETLTMWQQLFLVFAMPVKSPSSVTKSTIYDLSRATIAEAHAAGVF
jgi:hypothetical protein